MRMLRSNLENLSFFTGNLWFDVLNLLSTEYDSNFKSDLKHLYNIHLGEF